MNTVCQTSAEWHVEDVEGKQKTTFSSAEWLKLQASDPDQLHLRTITFYGSAAGEQDAKLLPGVLQDNQELRLAKWEEKQSQSKYAWGKSGFVWLCHREHTHLPSC